MTEINSRVALHVSYDGAEDVYLDLDVGHDLTSVELALAQLFGSQELRAERLWMRGATGEMAAVGAVNPRESQPIGQLLDPGQMHRVILSGTQPPIRA